MRMSSKLVMEDEQNMGSNTVLSHLLSFRLHLAQPEELSVEREEDLIEEDFLWKRQRQGDTSLEEENSLSERQEEKNKRVTETAFLVTRTNQQSLALVVVGSPLF